MSSLRSSSRARRFKPLAVAEAQSYADHINALGMIASLVGLLMQMKWAVWIGVYCSVVYMASAGGAEDKKQTFSLLILSASSLIMVYMQNPAPMLLA